MSVTRVCRRVDYTHEPPGARALTQAAKQPRVSGGWAVGDRRPAPTRRARIDVLVVAEPRLYREALTELLRRDQTVRVDTAFDLDEALRRVRSAPPDVIMLDTSMTNGTRAARALLRMAPRSKLLALAATDAEEEMVTWVEAGAAGYVTREAGIEELVDAVERVACGQVLCPQDMAAGLFRRLRIQAAGRRPGGSVERLTCREREIVALIDEGLSNKQIALRLCIEQATVKNHVHSILEKLGVGRRGEAAAVVRGRSYADG